MKKNKTGKYLKYALGEIVLVVIGILIALSINNWNETRKSKVLLETYTTSLIKDLQKDTLVLNEIINWVEIDNKRTLSLIQRLSAPEANDDTLIYIVQHDLRVEYKVYRPPNRNTLLNMQEKGLLELYNDEIYSLIIDLQTTQNISESIIVANGEVYRHHIERLLAESVIGEYKSIDGPLSTKAWQELDNVHLFRQIDALLSIKYNMSRSTNQLRKELLDKSVLLIDKLREIE